MDEVPAVLHTALHPGEAIVWHGRLVPSHAFSSHLVAVPFGLLSVGVALFANAPWGLRLFFLAGGVLFVGAPWIQRYRSRRTIVALTTTRVLVARFGLGKWHLRWIAFRDIAGFTWHARTDGTGDLVIRHRKPLQNYAESGDWETLVGVPDIRRVATAIADGRSQPD